LLGAGRSSSSSTFADHDILSCLFVLAAQCIKFRSSVVRHSVLGGLDRYRRRQPPNHSNLIASAVDDPAGNARDFDFGRTARPHDRTNCDVTYFASEGQLYESHFCVTQDHSPMLWLAKQFMVPNSPAICWLDKLPSMSIIVPEYSNGIDFNKRGLAGGWYVRT
jgi:hypothetical protein